jgi:hypothetical protein
MNPMPTDHEVEAELRAILRAESERITPEPALHRILERAHADDRPSKARRRRRWLPAVAGAVATAGIAAAAIVVFAPSDDGSGPTVSKPTVVQGRTLRGGDQVEVAVWFQNHAGQLISGNLTTTSAGNVGVDAVQQLLQEHPDNLINPWTHLVGEPRPIAAVNDVSHEDGVVTVDFDRPLSASASVESPSSPTSILAIQQLVLTVQSALRTDDPVRITTQGEPAPEAFEVTLSGPVPADWSLLSGIRPTSPTQGQTVTSPVKITGQSSTNEGNVLWEISRDDRVVKNGNLTGGANGFYEPYTIKTALEPGDYTVKLWEPNAASGPEAWTDEMFVVFIDFTVE